MYRDTVPIKYSYDSLKNGISLKDGFATEVSQYYHYQSLKGKITMEEFKDNLEPKTANCLTFLLYADYLDKTKQRRNEAENEILQKVNASGYVSQSK